MGSAVAALLAGELVNKLARFAAAVALARTLSLADFGAVNVAIAAAGIGLVLTNLGLPELGSRDIAAAPDDRIAIAGRVLAGRLLALLAVAVAAIGVVAVVLPDDLPMALLAAAMATGLALSADWILRGMSRMASLAIATGAGGIAVLAGVALIVPSEPSRELALGVFAAGELLVAVLTWRAVGVPPYPVPGVAGLRRMLRRSWPVGASALIVYSYYANLDTILLAGLRSSEEAGLYSAPYRVFLALNVIGTFAAYALLPVMTRLVVAGRVLGARDTLLSWLAPLACYGLIVLGCVELTAEGLLTRLFGSDFASMRSTFVLLCVAIPWYSVAFPAGYLLIARDQGRRFLIGAAVAGGMNLVLDLALIPPFGAEGAAIATMAALVAGSIAWLWAAEVPRDRAVVVVLALSVSLMGGAAVAIWEGLALPIGAATLLSGVLWGGAQRGQLGRLLELTRARR